MKNYFQTIFVTIIVISGLHLGSSQCNAQIPMENQLLNLFEKYDLENKVIFISRLRNNRIEYTVQSGWKSGGDDENKRGGDIVCQGNGISFAKCVQDYVNKGGSCIIYKYKSSDIYLAHKSS